MLLVQGSSEQLVLPATSATLASQLCGLSPPQPLERWLYNGLDHVSIIGSEIAGSMNSNGNIGAHWTSSTTIDDIVHWLSDRFAGGTWPDPYTPTGAGITPVTQTDMC